MGSDQNHLSGADGIRGLACLIVMAIHAAVSVNIDVFPPVAGVAKIGVWLFFVLSAYLLTIRLQSGETTFNYALGRILRIYPLYVLALAVHWHIGLGITNAEIFWRSTLFPYPYDPMPLMHLWTVPVEVSFYVLLPFILPCALWLQRRLGDGGLILALIGVTGTLQYAFPYWKMDEDSVNLFWYLPVFLFGIAAALLRHRSAPIWLRTAIITAILCGVVVSIPCVHELVLGFRAQYLFNKYVFFGLAFAVLVWCVVGRPDNVAARLFDTSILRWMGRVSYPTYLFNFVVLTKLSEYWSHPSMWAAPIYLAAIFICGWIVHVSIELPLAKLRRLIANINEKRSLRAMSSLPSS